jgi:GNAT superfamily N-acetyltransferase
MATIADQQKIQIVPYRQEYAADFARLNFEWLEGYALLEDADRKYLEDPQTHILDSGGEIFFALDGERVIATCAAIWHNPQDIELAKLAVSPPAQGRGLGRRMSETVIQFARQAGARKVILLSSTKLVAALRLYESLGFHYALAPADMGYETADVYMELELAGPQA